MASLERYRRSTGLSRNNSPQGSTSTASRSSTASTTGRGLTPTNENELRVGTRVHVQGKIGTIRYAGTTSFQTGKWIGIELDEPLGKNSGVVQGKRYFDCRMDHGVFVRPSQVKPLVAASTSEVPFLYPYLILFYFFFSRVVFVYVYIDITLTFSYPLGRYCFTTLV